MALSASPGPPNVLLAVGRERMGLRQWATLACAAVLVVTAIVWALLTASGDDDPNIYGAARVVCLVAAATGLAAMCVVLLSARSVRTVARYTLLQSFRMKLTGVFAVLLAVALVAVFQVKGDGTLGGRIRTFLDYTTLLTSVILSVMTLFLSIGIVASDVRNKQIFTVASKPVARWEYVVGRWFGVTAVNVILLAAAGGAIFGLSQYLRSLGESRDMPFEDRRTVETEIFVARRRALPEPLPVEKAVNARLAEMRKKGEYERNLETIMARARCDRELAENLMRNQIAKEMTQALQVVPPRRIMPIPFSGIEVAGSNVPGSGTVERVSRPHQLARLSIPPSLVGHLRLGAPVQVNGVRAAVYRAGRDFMDVQFAEEDMSLAKVRAMEAGRAVDILIVPTIQLRYELRKVVKIPEQLLVGQWLLINPETRVADGPRPKRLPMYSLQTVTVSAAVVSDDGRTIAQFTNMAPKSLVLNHDDLAILYPVGGFNWNFLRGMVLILLPVMFFAAVGVMLGSFVSFPVGCIAGFALYLVSLMMPFLTDATRLKFARDPITFGGHYVVGAMRGLLPNVPKALPGDYFVDGMVMSWTFVGEEVMLTAALRTLICIGLGCLIFHKRELARIQV